MSKDILSESGKEGVRVPLAPGSRPSDQAAPRLAAPRVDPSRIDCELMDPDGEGWSEWIHPLPGYRMQCCDCGLIHDMGFAITPNEGEPTRFNAGETEGGVIIFRARRSDAQPGWVSARAVGLEGAIADFKATLPGWWYSVGECQVSCDASCGPTRESADIERIGSDARFDEGFHIDLPQPSSLADALRAVMAEALDALRDRDASLAEDAQRLSPEGVAARASQEASPSPEIPNPGAPK